ncbi:DNA repair protein RecN [Planktosalinus lacus]|uniref:DNA repair protein RecN n=1 Tax=Planktosalinus lacus TaxID=1526573 RepID=A0A8J2V966_9FLAO|nr:DNA repair protein RecN [Planktosalinus lacus]GGD91496.1 DNA repair protein RecN [Planktosalinus lacus]
MITHLTIKNYALIEDIKVDFQKGLTIITGETGAGKSILLGALALLLGKRADLSSVKNSEKKCVIEAEFEVKNYKLQNLFTSLDLDYEDHTIIRREILPSGKSRAFVNDSPVNLSVLSELGDQLIDIHNQHQTLEVSSQNFQFEVLDALAKTQGLIQRYESALVEFKTKKKSLFQLKEKQQSSQKELDYNQHLLSELEEAKLKRGEHAEVEEEYEKLNNVEGIQETLSEIIQFFESEELGLRSTLNEIKSRLNKLKSYSKSYDSLSERIQSVQIELDDVFLDINSQLEMVEADPSRLQFLDERLKTLHKLQTKHHVLTIDELLEIQDKLSNEVDETSQLDERLDVLRNEINLLETQLNELAKEIHEKRASILNILKSKLEEILFQLGLPNASFKIELNFSDTFFENGKDELLFLFTANKGSSYGELKKVASGGELSRIMLAIKSVLANYSKLPTIIFDEIDTGVSGEIANKIGVILQSMSKNMQVVSITHLPQIAAKGDHHFKVYKEDNEEQTQTKLKQLNSENRLIEIAEMLSGDKKSESAIAHARELLN